MIERTYNIFIWKYIIMPLVEYNKELYYRIERDRKYSYCLKVETYISDTPIECIYIYSDKIHKIRSYDINKNTEWFTMLWFPFKYVILNCTNIKLYDDQEIFNHSKKFDDYQLEKYYKDIEFKYDKITYEEYYSFPKNYIIYAYLTTLNKFDKYTIMRLNNLYN